MTSKSQRAFHVSLRQGAGRAVTRFHRATNQKEEVRRLLAQVAIGGLIWLTALTLLVLSALCPWFAMRTLSDS